MTPKPNDASGMRHQRAWPNDARVVGLVGTSGSGKTTLALKLIAHWTAKGLRVATIKHAHAGFDIDHPGKDSMRHRQAGAIEVLVSSPARVAQIEERDQDDAPEASLPELLARVRHADLVLVEGFKAAAHPKLEVFRHQNGKQRLGDAVANILATATPSPGAGGDIDLDDATKIAAFLEDIAQPVSDFIESENTNARTENNASIIYLDHNATTPISPQALAAMNRVYTADWGNAGSIEHRRGKQAEQLLNTARGNVAASIGARADEVHLTSGATEANNLAILGCAKFRHDHEGKSRVVVAATEHKCVLEAAKNSGVAVSLCGVHTNGTLDLEHFQSLLDHDVALVSVMLVNNETGVVQDIHHIKQLCAPFDIKVHTDAAQALGKMAIDVGLLDVDFLSLSAHKAYGPMGVGALYVRRRPRARLSPIVHGGGQERGLRSGTVPLPLAVGFGVAARQAAAMQAAETARLSPLQTRLETQALALFPDAIIKNQASNRAVNTVNISLPGVDHEQLFAFLQPKFAISSGSACSSAAVEPSYVLTAMGLEPNTARSTLRVGMGRSTTAEQIDQLILHLAALTETL